MNRFALILFAVLATVLVTAASARGQFVTPNRAFHGGTFAANPISVTAGLATLSSLDEAAYQRLEALGSRARHYE